MSNWKTIITFTLPSDVYVAQSYLETEGIKTLLKDEVVSQENAYAVAVGGVKLQVKEENYKQAVEILKHGGYTPDTKFEDQQIEMVSLNQNTVKTKCPFCNSVHIGLKKEPNRLNAFVIFILGMFFPIFRKPYVCSDCGKEWKYVHK